MTSPPSPHQGCRRARGGACAPGRPARAVIGWAADPRAWNGWIRRDPALGLLVTAGLPSLVPRCWACPRAGGSRDERVQRARRRLENQQPSRFRYPTVYVKEERRHKPSFQDEVIVPIEQLQARNHLSAARSLLRGSEAVLCRGSSRWPPRRRQRSCSVHGGHSQEHR
jgi:hypothetical protein